MTKARRAQDVRRAVFTGRTCIFQKMGYYIGEKRPRPLFRPLNGERGARNKIYAAAGGREKKVFTMTKIDIVSGFLGAGKTTLIKKLLAEAFPGEKLVLIENEFGEISIDGGFLKDSGVQISEMSSGCICCSLVGDFNKALKDVHEQFHPDRILIEPSGVGKLSDVIVAVENTVKDVPDMKLNSFVTVADATKVKIYMKNFGEFYNNQLESAGTIILSRTQRLSQEKLEAAVALLREKNPNAAILTTPWDQLDGMTILSAIEKVSLADELLAHMRAEHEADEAEHEHEHHHHHHDEEHHDEHHHHHHHHHDDEGEAEEYGIQTYVYYSRPALDLNKFDDFVARKWPKNIIRCKGMLYFDTNPDMCYLFESAGIQKKLTECGFWCATAPVEELMVMMERDPSLRRDWDPKYGDRMIKLVFIGQNLDRKQIRSLLDACKA